MHTNARAHAYAHLTHEEQSLLTPDGQAAEAHEGQVEQHKEE